jgi:hypothetical protein
VERSEVRSGKVGGGKIEIEIEIKKEVKGKWRNGTKTRRKDEGMTRGVVVIKIPSRPGQRVHN